MALLTELTDAWLNLIALLWFLCCFNGYMRYARWKSKTTPCLASVMHIYRKEWMRRMLLRDNRIADTAAISNLERSVSFFASTTLLIMAGILTVMSSSEQAINLVEDLPFVTPVTRQEWELKLLVMLVMFVYAFFKFTWSLRQYGFASVMIGSAPLLEEQLSEHQIDEHADRAAKMTSMAANSFNVGLRTYYFSIAILSWLVNPFLFMLISLVIVFVLYRREFRSATLKTLLINTDKPARNELS